MCSALDGLGFVVPAAVAAITPRVLAEVLAWPSFDIADARNAPDRPGIYCIVIDDEHLVYTGISDVSLRKRWAQHHVGALVDQLGTPRVHYQVDDGRDLYWREIAIMQTFRPILNGWSMSRIVIDVAPDGRKSLRRRGWHEA